MDKLPNESDKLLSDKYILAKDIRDLNKTLNDSIARMKILEEEVKNKLKLKEKLEQYTKALNEIMQESGIDVTMNITLTEMPANEDKQRKAGNKTTNESDLQIQLINDALNSDNRENEAIKFKLNELIRKLTSDPELHELREFIRNGKKDKIRIMQLVIDNARTLTDQITILREKIKERYNAQSDVLVERDNLKAKMKDILEEFAGHKL